MSPVYEYVSTMPRANRPKRHRIKAPRLASTSLAELIYQITLAVARTGAGRAFTRN